ncbi:TetR/AcrR family transcriptional regulator [Corynebacterium suranareeae]|nr:TetR/AcrR family transcriptional regulator [Corynebacterium suranareeae]
MYSTSGEKLLTVATRLFYSEGIGAIGVDRVVAESGVSKPTLYAQFGTKAGLVAAVLQRRSDTRKREITEYLNNVPADTDSRVLALFDRFIAGHAKPGFRGCPFTNAAAELPDPEHPARVVIADYKTWIRQKLIELAAQDGLESPTECGSFFSLLIDGANVRVITTGEITGIVDAKQAASELINLRRITPGDKS